MAGSFDHGNKDVSSVKYGEFDWYGRRRWFGWSISLGLKKHEKETNTGEKTKMQNGRKQIDSHTKIKWKHGIVNSIVYDKNFG
jgi:hypothetical protein